MKPLHGVAVETDDVGEHGLGEHGRAARFFFQNDLQQDAAGQIVIGLCVAHHERLARHHQILDLRQRDVRRRFGVIQPAVGILLDDAQRGLSTGC
jgi:hypothetical protein